MKKILLCTLILVLSLGLSAGLWETHTNTSHIYDLQVIDAKVLYGSWGGALELSPLNSGQNYEQSSIWTTGDGLTSNDLRSIAKIGDNLWLGSSDKGISIVNQLGIQTLDQSLGLPSLKINAILELGSRILVATSAGLAEYYYLPGVSFPLILHQYTSANTTGGLGSNNITDLELMGDYVYVGTDAGLSYVHRDSLDVDAAWNKWTSPFQGYELKLAANSNKLLVAFGTNLYRSNFSVPTNDWENLSYTGMPTTTGLGIDEVGNAWVSYGEWNEDLSSFTTTGNILFSVFDAAGIRTDYQKGQDGLGLKTITDFAFEGSEVYLGSWGNGFYKKLSGQWVSFITNSVGFPKISEIATDQDNRVWFTSGYINPLPTKKGSLGVSYLETDQWHTLTMANSPLHNDSAHCLVVDTQNRVWFGAWDTASDHPLGWRNGITIFDQDLNKWWKLNSDGLMEWQTETETWSAPIPGKANLVSNTIGSLDLDQEGRILVAGYNHGITVINPDLTLHSRFTLLNSTRQEILYSYHNGQQYFFGTKNDNGLVIWNHPSVPVTDGDYWIVPTPPEIATCIVYGVATVETPYQGKQHWLLLSSGVFMWDEQNWYKYDTSIKRYRYNNGSWENNQLYYVDEERLFGSVRTLPNSMYLDPFGRIWIGSVDNGITMYNPRTDRFTNYFLPKDPMLANKITAMGYEPVNGLLWIGTTEGLNTLKVGRFIKPETELADLKAFPNPFRPELDSTVLISNLPADSMPQGKNRCRIYDSSGAVVIELEEDEFARFAWDGRSRGGSPVSSGIYFFVVSNSDGSSARGKLALIR